MIQFLPYALAAYGGYKGYKGAKKSGASGLQSILAGAAGAYGGYTLGQTGGFAANAGFGNAAASAGSFVPSFTQTAAGGKMATALGMQVAPSAAQQIALQNGISQQNAAGLNLNQNQKQGGSLLDILKSENDKGQMRYSPAKVSAAIAAGTFFGGAFDQEPTDIYMPGYNMNYLKMKEERPGYTYIDPETGQEKEYKKIYSPEEAGIGQPTMGPYSMIKQGLRTGGLAEIKKFNEGGINYLPSKVSHDEDDANNYVRASGYVEDGAGVGDKDEDTMLAQLADGEFVTRADGVLGAGIIAGANPNSMKDMREKGAQYFYEQQKRYKRVFDLIKDGNGENKQKTN
jgi:hypothetical protein